MTGTYCVVGGGISGLVAAYRLRDMAGPDAQILVFDPADRLGGVLRTETLAGQVMDIGAEAFIARRPEVPALLSELGLADRQIGTTGVRTTIYSQDRLHPLPPHAVNGIPSTAESMTGLVGQETVARIAAESQRAMEWQPGSDPAVGAVVGDRFGEQVVTRSVDPMLSGVYAGSAATIGIRSAVPTVAAALDAGAPTLTDAVRAVLPPATSGPVFGAIDGGYRVLLDALITRSALRWIPAAVRSLAADGAGWLVADEAGETWRADGVVVGATQYEHGRDTAPAVSGVRDLLDDACAVMPALGEYELAECAAGLRPMTPDSRPIIGPSPLAGLYLNTGQGMLGWTLACGSARLLTDLIDGKVPGVAAAPFSLLRFL